MTSGILNDLEIIETFAEEPGTGIISPFYTTQISQGNISYGLSSFGYDIRLSPDDFYIFQPPYTSPGIVDPKNMSKDYLHKSILQYSEDGDFFVIPPNSYALGVAVEYIEMPDIIMGICLGKSTYARAGIIVNMTPIEAGWRGYLTIEISNSTPAPCKVYADEGIAQILFFRGTNPQNTYEGRKYQDQPPKVVLSRL